MLGSIKTDDLRLKENTKNVVRKANARVELLRTISTFTPSDKEMKNIYILFIRSLLEQCTPVWHSSLIVQDSELLERVQKSAIKVILGKIYIRYRKSLQKLDLKTLHEGREKLCLSFARKCLINSKIGHLFPINVKKMPQSGICPAPCVLRQCTSPLPPLQYICKALH